MKLQGKAILVKPDENPDKTKGGVINPMTKAKPNTGTVIDHGPGCELVQKGDKVQYKRKGASVRWQNHVEHHFIIEEQIVFVYGN